MFLTQRALQFRSEHLDLFRSGDYLPLRVNGPFSDCVIAFARKLDRHSAVVIAPRLSSRVGFPPIGDRWKDTTIELPEGFPLERWRQVFTGHEFWIKERQIRVADALSTLPFAIIANVR
jgi:(1->4)-alpha-D-glucan 1-alpha-D-glucosylmutase